MAAAWLGTLAKVAPALATAIGGPFAGIAVSILGPLLHLDKPTVGSIQKVIEDGQMGPDQLAAFKQAELALQAHLDDNGIKLEQIAADDRDSARKLEESTHSDVPAYMTFLVTLGFFGLLGGASLHLLKLDDSANLTQLVGALAATWGACMQYWFGTTRSSADKDRTIAALT
jgi:hypothetical protein